VAFADLQSFIQELERVGSCGAWRAEDRSQFWMIAEIGRIRGLSKMTVAAGDPGR